MYQNKIWRTNLETVLKWHNLKKLTYVGYPRLNPEQPRRTDYTIKVFSPDAAPVCRAFVCRDWRAGCMACENCALNLLGELRGTQIEDIGNGILRDGWEATKKRLMSGASK